MDIVKHGKFHKNIYQIECNTCHCVFNYADYDIHGYAGIKSTENQYVTCPECHKWLRHDRYGKKIVDIKVGK